MVIKSRNYNSFLSDVKETFDNLREVQMKLNPKKCLFGKEEGKCLLHMITKEGIKENHKKFNSIVQFRSPRTVKLVLALNDKLVALGRFLAKSAEKTLPFYKTLKM